MSDVVERKHNSRVRLVFLLESKGMVFLCSDVLWADPRFKGW